MPDPNNNLLERFKKFDEQRSVKSSAPTSTTTTESPSPTAGTTPASTPTVSMGAWDSQIKPLIKKNGWESNFDDTKTLYLPALKKVLNGEYDKLGNTFTDENSKSSFNAFKKSAEDYKNMLIDIDKGVKIPNDKFQKISFDWQSNFSDFANNTVRPKAGNPGLDPKTFNLMDHRTYLKESIMPFIDTDKSDISTNVKYDKGIIGSIFGGNKMLEDPGYTKLVDWEADYKNQIDENVSSVLDSWSNLSIYNINKKDNTNYKNDVYNYVNASLNFINNNGANTGDETKDGIYKKNASNILNLVKGKSLDDAIEIIKQNNVDIHPLLTNTGYINKVNLYKQFIKEGIGKNDLYYKKDSTLYDKVNLANAAIENENYYKSEVTDYKKAIKDEAKSLYSNSSLEDVKNTLFDNIVNEFGDVVSLEDFKKKIKSMPSIKVPIENKGMYRNTYSPDGIIQPSIKEVAFDQYIATKNSSVFNPLPEMGYRIDPQLDDIYEDIKTQYKQTFDKVKPNETLDKYKNTLYTLGIGDVVTPNLYFEGVDLSVDNNNQFVNSSSNFKQQNAIKLLNSIKTGKRINTDNVVILNTNQVNNGLNAYDIDDFQSDKENNSKNYEEFFKDNKNLDFTKMSFQRYSNVPGHAYYEFEDEKNKKLGILIPYNKLEDISEDLYIKTKESPVDRAFHFTGKYEIPGNITDEQTGKVIIKDRRIDLDDKTKNNIITFDYLLDNGEWGTHKIDAGHTSGTTIETTKSIMNNSIDLFLNQTINK